jgi:hypothetical protein
VAGDDVAPSGERPGLVEQRGVDCPHPLERQPVLHEDPGPRRHRGRQRDHERDGEAEGVWAGDDEHRDGAGDGLVDVAGDGPSHERDHRGTEGDPEEQRGEAVRERLRPAATLLGVGDEAFDAGQRGVGADGVNPEPDRRVGRDRSRHHRVACGLRDRLGLTGDH